MINLIKRIVTACTAAFMLLAATPAPAPLPTPELPTTPLHAHYTVEVNRMGQVVRVDHGNLSGNQAFDTMTLGNAMQMWIRRPNGSSIPGLYSIRYDYDSQTHKISRIPSLVRKGGPWANKPGAATLIVKEAQRQTKETYTRLKAEYQKAQAQRAKHLPDINAAVRRARVSPSPKP